MISQDKPQDPAENNDTPSNTSISVTTGGAAGTPAAYLTGGGLGTFLVFLASTMSNNDGVLKNVLYFIAPAATLLSSHAYKLGNEWWTKKRIKAQRKEAEAAYKRAVAAKLPLVTLEKMRKRLDNLAYLEFVSITEGIEAYYKKKRSSES